MSVADVVKLGIYGSIANVTAQKKLLEVMNNAEDAKGTAIGATITTGPSHTDTVNVAVQLTDEAGDNVAGLHHLRFMLFTTAVGAAFNTLTLTTETAVGTAGTILVVEVAHEMYTVLTNDAGLFDVDIVYTTGAGTLFLAVVLPSNELAVSTVVTFTA